MVSIDLFEISSPRCMCKHSNEHKLIRPKYQFKCYRKLTWGKISSDPKLGTITFSKKLFIANWMGKERIRDWGVRMSDSHYLYPK